jgi:ppGpp synthetase/RelA/SpoT-type nucleotidyltranferase
MSLDGEIIGRSAGQGHWSPAQPSRTKIVSWVKPEFSREEINRAGKTLVNARAFTESEFVDVDWNKFEAALAVINNWRSSHGYPLISLRINLASVAKKFDSKPLIAQRVKRLVSISAKLERFPSMKLSQMQDLGGCRAILSNVAAVRKAVEYYRTSSRMLHELASIDDYIESPKESGYRGVHLVYRFKSENRHKRPYNGLKIELQLRSAYQHAWATAVETVGTFSGQALKSSLGSEQWQTFFSLMSSEIALREKTPLVPNTPHNRSELREALRRYANVLKVQERLRGYREAVKAMSNAPKKSASFFLLQLDPSVGRLIVNGYDGIEEAAKAYESAEKGVREKEGTDAVLVSVESISALGKAYPNYFADTRVFVQLVNQALSGRSRGIEVSPVPIVITPQTGQLNFEGDTPPATSK